MDPRVARSQAAVVRAATDLLVEGGPSAVTVDAIVARSGVAKSTIYRHWDSRDDILFAVLEACAPDITAPPADLGYEAALRDLVGQILRMTEDPEWTRVFPALLMMRAHESTVEHLQQRMENEQHNALAEVLERGVAEGKVRPGLDVELVAATLLGPLVFAHLTGKVSIDQSLGDHVIDVALATFAP
ncbi:MAG: TetR/AcrR family transcriptional regulator [Desertimonas sp.]